MNLNVFFWYTHLVFVYFFIKLKVKTTQVVKAPMHKAITEMGKTMKTHVPKPVRETGEFDIYFTPSL